MKAAFHRLTSVLLLLLSLSSYGSCEENTDSPNAGFKVVLVPGTQYHTESYPKTYPVQTNWIRQRVEAYTPWLHKYDKRPKHTYTPDYDMSEAKQ